MKRFYLIICFLMSIIGSAWGQETGKLTMDASEKVDFTTISSDDGQIQLSFDLGTEEQIESSQRGIQYDSSKNAYKFRKTYGVGIITPLNNGVVVNEVKLTIHSSKRDFNYFVGESDTPTLISCVENEGVTTNTFTNNNSESEVVRFALANDNNCYVSKIEVTYTYTTVSATGISLNQTTSVLPLGETLTLNDTVEPADATTETIWTTSDASVATVENGVVTAIKAGVVTITATNNGHTATCTVVVPEVLSVGTTQKTATVANITSFSNCVITKSGQLMDCALNNSYVIFRITPEVSGTYSFTSKIATPQTGETVELFCGNTSLGVKNITPSGNASDWSTGEEYTWTCTLEQGQTYDIKVVCAHDGDAYYTANVFNMDITLISVPTPYVTAFTVQNLNYPDNTSPSNSADKKSGLNRNLSDFTLTFTGDTKHNTPNLIVRNGTGVMTVSLTQANIDAGIRITAIDFNDDATVGDLTTSSGSIDTNTKTWSNESGVVEVSFTSNSGTSLAFSSIDITTTDTPVNIANIRQTPIFAFAQTEISANVSDGSIDSPALTTDPENFDNIEYSIEEDLSSTGTTVDKTTGKVTLGATAGTVKIKASYNGKFKDANGNWVNNPLYKPQAAYYTIQLKSSAVAGDWDFTTWETADETVLQNTEIWEPYNSETGRYANTGDNGALENYAGLSNTHNGLTLTAPTGTLSIYYSTDGDGSIRLHNSNALINLPALTAGQTITIDYYTTSSSDARGPLFTGENADKLKMISGDETSKERTTVTYYVTENISGASFTSSHNGLRIYSVELGAAQLYWQKNGTPVASLDVYEGTTTYNEVTLNNPEGVTYTVTPVDNGSSSDITASASGISVNSFTLGNSYLVTATSSAGEATLKVSMRMNAEISYSVTEAEGQMGFSFVEPVLTKNPAGLNVVKWKSSDPAVATVVADNGEVTFVSAGTTIITAYIEENNYYAYQEASYTLTVTEAVEIDTPWELSVVEAPGTSVATGSIGHKLTMTKTGTIKAGQVTTEIPGLTLSFGRTGDADWNVYQENDHFGGLFVAGGAMATLASDTDENASGYLPTGGTYLGLEPTVNGVLSLHTAYYNLQQIVVVDKETNTIIASRRPTDDNHFEDYEFTVPLQADHTYYVYNFGNPNRGDATIAATRYAMPVNAITFTPVFLDRIGHVIVNDNEYNITGAQLADDIHDYPTFSNVHAEEGGSVTYESSDKDVAYFDEEGNLIVAGKAGTTTLQAYVSHVKDDATCSSVAQCTVTYTKSQLEFSGTGYTLADNLVSEFTEPTLTLPAALSSSTVTYSVDNGFGIDSNTGNIINVSGSGITATVTATISPENIYFNPTATYTITSATQQVPFEVLEEITVPVGTRAFSLIREDENGVLIDATGNVVIDLDDNLYGNGDGDKNTWGKLSGMSTSEGSYNNVVKKFFNANSIKSTDPGVVKINNRMQIDALAEGTVTVSMQSNQCTDGSSTYGSRDITIKINVVKDTESDYYESIYNGTGSTYRTWNFHNGFDATELSSYDNGYTALGNSNPKDEAENFITHIPSGHDFWIYDSENNTLKSNISITVTDNKIDRESIAFIANEPMNGLSLTSTATNCFASSKGTIDDYRTTGEEPSYTYDDDDKNVLTFYTFKTDRDEWEGTKRNDATNITFNAQTNMCGITGVDKDEHVTPYRSIQLSGKAAFIRVNDIKPGMWMSVIADNNNKEGVAFVQLASDGAEVQAMGQTLYSGYSDSKDANLTKYPYNRVTNVFPYLKSDGKTVAIEQEGASGVTNIMVGYPAGMGTLNVGGGEKSPKINNIQRTYGYATFVSPYNIDLTGQTALKAYICDYYGKDNNLVHMVQIKHIPANTPVMLKGYARDMYVLYISEGNKDVDHGISEEVFAKNRLVGAMEDGMMVQPTEEGLHNGAVTTWHNMGLTQNKFLTFTVASPIAKGRAYLRITQEEYEDLYAAHVSASAASTSTKIVFEDTDFDYSSDVTTPTGIENLENVTVTVGDGHYYNLNGVRVNGIPTQKGIYIRNGKKIVVR